MRLFQLFCTPRPVPLALQDDLEAACDAGVAKGVVKPTIFSNQEESQGNVISDTGTVNRQFAPHRHPMSLPNDLEGSHFFSKINLADGYNQLQLSPASKKHSP
ncbi:transposon Tf2-6 polyprotein [Elysia marginata]|uniref:Transposon Tf2-6 polyprotein n=1 Tax=Elysia marginata TaxID=1093978 RepID=A0AAV4H3Q3_9GAST|nr:transposon Tf2-6 polyprotein [Elysia marginata]